MKICLIGSTGLVGSIVAEILDRDQTVELVTIGRRKNESLQNAYQIIETQMSKVSDDALTSVDIFINCLGTTIKDAGSKERFKEIDHDLVLAIAKKFKGKRLINLSSLGAHKNANVYYSKIKGELEVELNKLSDEVIHIRPSLLIGPRKSFRAGEFLAQKVMPAFNPLLPKKLKAVDAKEVAKLISSVALNIDYKTDIEVSRS